MRCGRIYTNFETVPTSFKKSQATFISLNVRNMLYNYKQPRNGTGLNPARPEREQR